MTNLLNFEFSAIKNMYFFWIMLLLLYYWKSLFFILDLSCQEENSLSKYKYNLADIIETCSMEMLVSQYDSVTCCVKNMHIYIFGHPNTIIVQRQELYVNIYMLL